MPSGSNQNINGLLKFLFNFFQPLRFTFDVPGQTKILWSETTRRKKVMDTYKLHNKTHDGLRDEHKQTGTRGEQWNFNNQIVVFESASQGKPMSCLV